MNVSLARAEIQRRVEELGKWFHNIDLGGVETAPDHFLGDYPNVKWKNLRDSIPADLSGMTVLDIGCNGGFYALEMKRRGADRVVGVDSDGRYLAQARFASEVTGLKLELRQMDVYNIAALGEKFDLVIFMGVLYHLRHPLLALDLLNEHAVKDTLVFQSLIRGSDRAIALKDDYPFGETELFRQEGFPVLHFVEKKYSADPTNWWIPNRSCVEAMLRSAGFEIVAQPEQETYICKRKQSHG
jgi:tRNA (mo5U34)-methyltransferase